MNKKTGLAMVILVKIDLKARRNAKDKEGHFITLKVNSSRTQYF